MHRSRTHVVAALVVVLALFVAQAPASADQMVEREHGPLAISSLFEQVTEAFAGFAGRVGETLGTFFGADGANIETDP